MARQINLEKQGAIAMLSNHPESLIKSTLDRKSLSVELLFPEIKMGIVGSSGVGKTHLIGSFFEMRQMISDDFGFMATPLEERHDPIKDFHDALCRREDIPTTLAREPIDLSIREGMNRYPIANVSFQDIPGQYFSAESAGSTQKIILEERRKSENSIKNSDIILLCIPIDTAWSADELKEQSNETVTLLDAVQKAWQGDSSERVLTVLFCQVDRFCKKAIDVTKFLDGDIALKFISIISGSLRSTTNITYNFFPVSAFGLGRSELDNTTNAYKLKSSANQLDPYGISYAFFWSIAQYFLIHGNNARDDFDEVISNIDQCLEKLERLEKAATRY